MKKSVIKRRKRVVPALREQSPTSHQQGISPQGTQRLVTATDSPEASSAARSHPAVSNGMTYQIPAPVAAGPHTYNAPPPEFNGHLTPSVALPHRLPHHQHHPSSDDTRIPSVPPFVSQAQSHVPRKRSISESSRGSDTERPDRVERDRQVQYHGHTAPSEIHLPSINQLTGDNPTRLSSISSILNTEPRSGRQREGAWSHDRDWDWKREPEHEQGHKRGQGLGNGQEHERDRQGEGELDHFERTPISAPQAAPVAPVALATTTTTATTVPTPPLTGPVTAPASSAPTSSTRASIAPSAPSIPSVPSLPASTAPSPSPVPSGNVDEAARAELRSRLEREMRNMREELFRKERELAEL